jgi:hypothetical protein
VWLVLFFVFVAMVSKTVQHGACSLREWGVWVLLWCFDVVETSYEGHMVDALASRADEGRWSLR